MRCAGSLCVPARTPPLPLMSAAPARGAALDPADVEAMGLDISYHGGSSYPHERPAATGSNSLRLGSEAVRGHQSCMKPRPPARPPAIRPVGRRHSAWGTVPGCNPRVNSSLGRPAHTNLSCTLSLPTRRAPACST